MAQNHSLWYIFTMNEQAIEFNIPLQHRPEVLWIAEGRHGPNDTRTYRFESLWIIHLYTYTGTLVLDGVELQIRPGFAGIMPPGATSMTHFPERSRHLFAHFALPSSAEHAARLPAMQDLGPAFPSLVDDFERAIAYYETNPLRAEVKLWNILWQLADRDVGAPRFVPSRHPALEHAMDLIVHRLGEPICVGDLAAEVSLSHNHLIRLFREATGASVVEHIRRLRVEKARYLLVHSSLPIKAVAAEVGLPDLHHFNKTIRRALGESPRRVRSGAVQDGSVAVARASRP